MKLAEKTFKRKDYVKTTKYGWRTHPITKMPNFHQGEDYGTKGQKWDVFPLETGIIVSVGFDSLNGNFLWIEYPRISKRAFYCHLDTVYVNRGMAVNENTVLAKVGTTGRSTGIHLHFGLKDFINGKWVYIDPDSYDYGGFNGIWDTEFTLNLQHYYGTFKDGIISGQIFQKANENVRTRKRGLFGSQLVRKIQEDLGVKMDGQLGKQTIAAWQKRYGLAQDGYISNVSNLVKEVQKRLKEGQPL